MKILKFEKFNESLFNFKRKKVVNNEPEHDTESKFEYEPNSTILIENEPYEENNFHQKKYRVFIKKNNKTYYIGDLRKFNSTNKYISYINIDNIREKEPEYKLVDLTFKQLELVDDELDKGFLSKNLMDDIISNREKLKNDFNIIL